MDELDLVCSVSFYPACLNSLIVFSYSIIASLETPEPLSLSSDIQFYSYRGFPEIIPLLAYYRTSILIVVVTTTVQWTHTTIVSSDRRAHV